MDIHDQSEAIAFLSTPATYGETEAVKVIETHISLVFLIDGRAYKLKRAVKLPYVDFSTYDLRLHYCRREVELNARATPDLYLGIRRITREPDGRLVFDGTGEAIDVVVEMNRFAQHDLFDRMASEGRLYGALMRRTAEMIAGVHARAPIIHDGSGSANMAGVLDINEAGFATSHVFDADATARLTDAFRQALAKHADRMDRRELADKVRLCHGDLHLRNLFMSPAGPRMFDCIDFNDQIATVDVLYDLAFLLMDLWHRGFAEFANIVANRYLDISRDDDGFALLPFFMAVRAAVRAHVSATQIEEGADAGMALTHSAKAYFTFAGSLLCDLSPRLVAIGGLSGSGKSTLADALAPRLSGPPGARILESDRIRKAMFGVAPEDRLPVEAYRPEVSRSVYADLTARAKLILSDGGTVLVDAVFDREDDRNRVQSIAETLGVPFTGLWLDADPQLLATRVRTRPQGTSDATLDVLQMQLVRDLGSMRWQRIDTGRPMSEVLADVDAWLR